MLTIALRHTCLFIAGQNINPIFYRIFLVFAGLHPTPPCWYIPQHILAQRLMDSGIMPQLRVIQGNSG